MELDFLRPLIPAIIVVVLVLVLEEWAYFQARSKFQRAIITGAAVFALVFVFWNIF